MKLPYGTAGKLSSKFPAEAFPEHAKNFAEQVQLYKALAKSSWNEPSPEQKAKMEEAIARFKELGKRLEQEIADFADEDFSKPDERLDDRVASLALFMYLFDKTLELHDAVMKKGKIGLNALFDSTRNSMYSLLSGGFFVRSFLDDVKDYLADEPLFVACAELAEVELLPLDMAVAAYQPKLKEKVLPLINEEGDESGKGGSGAKAEEQAETEGPENAPAGKEERKAAPKPKKQKPRKSG